MSRKLILCLSFLLSFLLIPHQSFSQSIEDADWVKADTCGKISIFARTYVTTKYAQQVIARNNSLACGSAEAKYTSPSFKNILKDILPPENNPATNLPGISLRLVSTITTELPDCDQYPYGLKKCNSSITGIDIDGSRASISRTFYMARSEYSSGNKKYDYPGGGAFIYDLDAGKLIIKLPEVTYAQAMREVSAGSACECVIEDYDPKALDGENDLTSNKYDAKMNYVFFLLNKDWLLTHSGSGENVAVRRSLLDSDKIIFADRTNAEIIQAANGGIFGTSGMIDGTCTLFFYDSDFNFIVEQKYNDVVMKDDNCFVRTLNFSADNKHVAVSYEHYSVDVNDKKPQPSYIIVSSTDTNKHLFSAPGNMGAVSKDGSLVSVWADGGKEKSTGTVYNILSGQAKFKVSAHVGHVVSNAWSPDGSIMASGGSDGIVNVWDVHNGHHLAMFGGFPGPVCSMEFTPSGRGLISKCPTELRLYDVATGHQLQSYKVGVDDVSDVRQSSDGSSILVLRYGSAKSQVLERWQISTTN